MRFIENGPNIPDELLEARDKGEVVFICGAGVSIPAGLPNFANLAKGVMTDLGVSKGHPALLALEKSLNSNSLDYAPPIDQIFNVLKKEFHGQVQHHVSKRLRVPKNAILKYHETILDLSSDVNGNPRVVTTNFDHMFEAARKGIRKYSAPELPDFTAIQRFEGVVYLHGRLPPKGSSDASIILSSSDFGRAYLTQGWAARFVRELLQLFTVVLLGYSANDPPIRYLLEGLENSDFGQRHKIFAFDSGTPEEVDARWRDRNVRGISYFNTDQKHESLWQSLHAWAARAKDPIAWRKSTVELAKLGPTKLNAFQRGQIISLVSSQEGAKAFADEDVPPPAEWICVFDRNQRYAKAHDGQKYGSTEPSFDPLAAYGLDDDPPRDDQDESQSKKRESPAKGIDILSLLPSDDARLGWKRLSNSALSQSDRLPARLFYILRWIGKHMGSPTIAWWVGRQRTLHHEAVNQLKWQLRNSTVVLPPVLRSAWDLLIEHFESKDGDALEYSIYELEAKLKVSGWSASFLRDLEFFMQPQLAISLSIFSSPEPRFVDLEKLGIRDIVTFEAKFPKLTNETLNVPDDRLPIVLRFASRGLERASSLMKEVAEFNSELPTLYPEVQEGGLYHDDRARFFIWVARQFNRLVELDAAAAEREFGYWPDSDEFHFDKLKLLALAKEKAFKVDFVFQQLMSMSSEAFWKSGLKREFLFLLQKRWQEFSGFHTESLVKRILAGPEKWPEEEDEKYSRRKAIGPLFTIGWLRENNCDLPTFVKVEIAKLQKSVPEWQPDWAKSSADSLEGRSGWVQENTDFSVLQSAQLSEIVGLAQKHSVRPFHEFTDYRPFKGLLSAQPFFALCSLTFASRKGEFPISLWQDAISSWPDNTSLRLRWFLAHHISRLPNTTFMDLRHSVAYWIKKQLPELAKSNLNSAFEIWDQIISKFIDSGAEATKSNIGEISVGGKVIDRSRRTYQYSHGPIGELAETLYAMLDNLKLQKSSGIPDDFRSRIEKLWEILGEGADHALSNAGIRLLWLDYLDSNWVETKLLPFFKIESKNAEPVWSGFFYTQNLARPNLFQKIKQDFLGLSSKIFDWGWGDDEQRQYASRVVSACWNNSDKRQYINWEETRDVLKKLGDAGRVSAIGTVAQVVAQADGWKKFGKSFIEKAWPQEAAMQTSATSYAMINLADSANGNFSDAVNTISAFVRQMDHPDMFIFKMKKGDKEDHPALATQYPVDVLKLLDRIVPPDQQYPPYDLASLLTLIAESDATTRQDVKWLRLRRLADLG